MFTRRRKLTNPPPGDEPAEIALPGRPKKTPDVWQDRGDEIEKISQDFQVAQLESLKAKTHAVAPTVPPIVSIPTQAPKAAVRSEPKSDNLPRNLPADVMTSKPSAQPQVVPAEPSSGLFSRNPQNTALPQSLLNSLLSEIVERDIQRQRQRLNGKK